MAAVPNLHGKRSQGTTKMEEPTNLILEHLRALRAGQDRLGERLDETIARLGSIESQIGNLHREVAHLQQELARHDLRFDGIDRRLDRIERRLELVSN
jgi:archaellum component FlaC